MTEIEHLVVPLPLIILGMFKTIQRSLELSLGICVYI